MTTRPRHVLLLALLACAPAPGPRVLVQADALDKQDFEGEWYFRQTVVGVPYTTGFTFIGEQGENELEKVRFDIAEDVLVARRAHEFVRGTELDQPSQQTNGAYLGAPVAAFRIKGHFDIVRDYNPATGEEYDRVVENTERKWFERRFMRVDWSTNLVTNFEFLADYDHGGLSNIRQDPVPYYVSDPRDPDALRVERPDPKSRASYLEVTQKLIAAPESVDFEDFANVPLCWLEYATQDCASQEIKVRNSFLRAEARDYDPLVYTDRMMDRFGYFTTERASYNRQYGQTETGRLRFINRFNIWRRTLTDTTCRLDADCGDAALGRRCSLDAPGARMDPVTGARTGRCTLPFAARNLEDPSNPASRDLGPRPVVYHLDDAFPADLKEAGAHLFDEYEATFRDIHKGLTGRDAVSRTFQVCVNNPVREGDPAACGPAGTHARIGDLRFNLLMWVDNPTSARLLGYGPSSADPETGETIQANAFIYGAEVDLYAATARDLVRLVNGDLRPTEFVKGENVRRWVDERLAGERRKTFTQAEVDAAAGAMNTSWTAGLPRLPAYRKGGARSLAELTRARSGALARSSLLGADPGLSTRRLAVLDDTGLERRLMNGELLLARGLDPRTSLAALDPAQVRPLRFMSPEIRRVMRSERRRLGAHGVDLAESVDDAALGFALAQKGKDPQEVWRTVRRLVFLSTAEHEVGHTLGLRHNFAGSFDAMNYPKTYWDLRTAGGPPKQRYLEAETEAELRGVELPGGLRAGISEFQTSSIMDYGAKFNSDIQGIGKYDRAAIKFGYGELVEVFEDVRQPYLLGALQSTVTFGMPAALVLTCDGNDLTSLPYTELPTLVDLEKRADVPFSRVRNVTPQSTCAYPDPVDVDPGGKLVVPYRFCSDEFESASIGCAAYDRGADVQEVAQNYLDSYRNLYIFNNFKRDRMGFDPEGYLDRIFERYLEPLRQQAQFYVLFRADYADFLPDDGTPGNFWRSPEGWGAYTVAVKQGFDLLGHILTTPEPGAHNRQDRGDGLEALLSDEGAEGRPDLVLPIPDGRYLQTSWDYDSGYYWYEQITHVGTFLDKIAALIELTDPETSFVGKDESSDLRQFAINYWRLYPTQLEHLFGAVLTDDWARLAPVWSRGSGVTMRNISEPLAPVPDRVPVDPQIGFSVQLWAGTLGMALVPATWDQTFANSARVFLKGTGAAVDPTRALLTWSDPNSGLTYQALSFPKDGAETGIAARMLERAAFLESRLDPAKPETAVQLQAYVEMLEVMRTLSLEYADALR
jgi:hypothetical protein